MSIWCSDHNRNKQKLVKTD